MLLHTRMDHPPKDLVIAEWIHHALDNTVLVVRLHRERFGRFLEAKSVRHDSGQVDLTAQASVTCLH